MSHVTLPMYHLAEQEPAKAAFWAQLAARLAREGYGELPSLLTGSDPWEALLTTPGLLLGQTCGFPMLTLQQGRVKYVATPCYDVPGCDGPYYSSAIMVRDDDPATDIDSLRGRTIAFNAPHSQSGYNTIRALIAPLAKNGRFFGGSIETGGHHASLMAVRDGNADCCSADAISLAFVQQHRPDDVAGLRRIAWSQAVPGLPFITAPTATDRQVASLRRALAGVINDPTCQDILKPMRIKGVQVLDVRAYDVILDQMNRAARLGVVEL